jgi:mannose-6-phosphate isomerase-like protein (cupin superfamily)
MDQTITPSAGETFWVVGHQVTILPAGAGYSYADVSLQARTPGPPPHRHADCSELFHVLEGRVNFEIGEDRLQLGPGESVLVPRDVVHTFYAASEAGSRLISVHAPAGFDRWFRAMGVPADEPNARELSVRPEIIDRIMRESIQYDMEIVDGKG